MTDRARHWRGLVDAWETSGLSQAKFCRRRGVKAVTFGWWKRRLKGARTPTGGVRGGRGGGSKARGHAEIADRGRAQFVEVAMSPTAPAGEATSSAAALDGNAACRSSSDYSASRGCYEIVLNGGRVIRLPRSFEPAVVARLVTVLESC